MTEQEMTQSCVCGYWTWDVYDDGERGPWEHLTGITGMGRASWAEKPIDVVFCDRCGTRLNADGSTTPMGAGTPAGDRRENDEMSTRAEWEYMVVGEKYLVEERLSELGDAGWEAIGVVRGGEGAEALSGVLFKRRRKPPQEK